MSEQREREFAFTDKDFEFLSQLVNTKTGIVLSSHKKDMVYSRLARRLRALKIDTFSEYCSILQGQFSADEMGNLVNAITTNLTKFFREQHHFEHLRDEVLAPMIGTPQRRLRIWSAGCSSGMEPYSISMVLKDRIKSLGQWDAKILATDIDTTMLKTGEEGIYSIEQLSNIPSEYQSYLSKVGNDSISMSPDIRRLITFKQLNLLDKWPMSGPFDAVFCRNVVIYFDKNTQKGIFERMARLVKPNGWLYIGHSESLHKISDDFKLVGRTIYQRLG